MLEIPPTAASADAEPARQTAHDAVDRVIRRAEELRRSWSKTSGAGARSSPRVSTAVTV